MSSPLKERGKALEAEFFRKEEVRKLAAHKTKQQVAVTKAGLRAASGMTDDAVLDQLLALGIDADTVAALSLVPLVVVAWADAEIQDREREAIMTAAQGKGIEPGSSTHELLDAWLTERPGPELTKAWVGYVDALDDQLTTQQLEILERQVIGRARAVAEAAGGILGFKKVSDGEKKVLSELQAAFQQRAEKTK